MLPPEIDDRTCGRHYSHGPHEWAHDWRNYRCAGHTADPAQLPLWEHGDASVWQFADFGGEAS